MLGVLSSARHRLGFKYIQVIISAYVSGYCSEYLIILWLLQSSSE